MDECFDLEGKSVWVAGHRGMVGSALVARLASEKCRVITVERRALDLRRQADTETWLGTARPDVIFLAAAKVGGILANQSKPADFIFDNLAMAVNVIHAAHVVGVQKLVFLGSSCIYPKFAPQPIEEPSLLTGSLESSNEWYAIAKIAGIKLCQAFRQQYRNDFISAMPTNLYGPNDNFDLHSSHVLPALIRKAHEAKVNRAPTLEVWGTGTVRREFLHVEDCADALVHLCKVYSAAEHVNVGTSEDITIAGLAELVAAIVGFQGSLTFDATKPDGTPRKLMSGSKLASMGWRPRIGLEDGIRSVYDWFLANKVDCVA